MASFVPTDPGTLEDRRLYTEARLVDVACLDCTAVVKVKKNSDQHTQIQWSDEAVGRCAEFARMAASPGGRPLRAGCSRLSGSIDTAVRDGQVPVGAEDGY